MIDHIRYFVGVELMLLVPLGVLYWFIIHLGASRWRGLGPKKTYLIVLPILAGLGVLLFQVRGLLLGRDLKTNWSLLAIALLLSGCSIWFDVRNWRQLNIPTLVGLPELSAAPNGKLVRDGFYRVVRHPRYLIAGLGVLAGLLIVNYLGLYILVAAMLAPGYLMLLLEERELVGRFGDAYREYQREVPQLIPRMRRFSGTNLTSA